MKKFSLGFLCSFLFAVYPAIFLYAHNAGELTLTQIVLPLAVMSALGLAMFLMGLLTKSPLKAALISSVVTSIASNYGIIYENILPLLPAAKHWHMVPSVLLIAAYAIYFISRAKTGELIKNLTLALTLVMTILVGFNLFSLAKVEARKYLLERERTAVEPMPGVEGADYPDVYHILLDEYASNDTIRDVFGYDNSDFISALEQRGFYHADKSKSGHTLTTHSIVSTLNMDTLSSLFGTDDIPSEQLIAKINDNKVFSLFKEKGYKTVAIDTMRLFTSAINLNAEEYKPFAYQKDSLINSGYSSLLLERTIASPFLYSDILVSTQDFCFTSINAAFSELLAQPLADIERPKYVYAHITCPHSPFVFDRYGNRVRGNEYDTEGKQPYLEQYIYATGRALEAVDSILKNSEREPIIVLQSDHGVRGVPDASEDDALKIFNAIYLPEDMREGLYNNISPVNTYRLISNKLFGTDYEMLEGEV